MNILLIGFMGSGKSTVAQHLSKLLGLTCVEMDQLVYDKTQTNNMDEVFAKGGETLLRETEIEIAKEYASKKNQVISTGGGIVMNKIILDYFKAGESKVIFLHASFHKISQQLAGDCSRPLFRDLKMAKELYDFRLPLYATYADATIEVDPHTPSEIALKIQELIGSTDGL